LHSFTLKFLHPYTLEEITLTAPVDEVFENTLKLLKLYDFCPETAF
jgi:hypothetical protein